MMPELAGKSLKIGLLLAVTLVLVATAVSWPLLAFYGNDYANNARGCLIVLLASILPSTILAIYLSVLRVRDQLHSLLFLTAASMVSGLLLAYFMMQGFGLIGAGLGWLLSRLLMVSCVAVLWKLQPGRPSLSAHTSLNSTR
jgi:O-antigen/teichoic acid export membrane protein